MVLKSQSPQESRKQENHEQLSPYDPSNAPSKLYLERVSLILPLRGMGKGLPSPSSSTRIVHVYIFNAAVSFVYRKRFLSLKKCPTYIQLDSYPKGDAERPVFFDWSWNTQEKNFPSPTSGHWLLSQSLRKLAPLHSAFSHETIQQPWNRHSENKNFLKNNSNVNFQNGKLSWHILTARTPKGYSPKDVFLRFKTQLNRNIQTCHLKTRVTDKLGRVHVWVCPGRGVGVWVEITKSLSHIVANTVLVLLDHTHPHTHTRKTARKWTYLREALNKGG